MVTYSDEEKEALEQAKNNKDPNDGNAQIVRIVAKKVGKESRLVSLELPAGDDAQISYDMEEGRYLLRKMGKTVGQNLLRLGCATKSCKIFFSFLSVHGKALGYFNDAPHNHAPHLIPFLVQTFELLAMVHTEGDTEGTAPYVQAHTKIQSMLGTPSAVDKKCLLYFVLDPQVAATKEEFEALSLEEKFGATIYTGQADQTISERLITHGNSDNIYQFTCGGSRPSFIVLHTERELSGGQATFWETRLITLTASHHAVINSNSPAPWTYLPDASPDEEYMAVAKQALELYEDGDVYEVDWTSKLAKTKRKPPPLVLSQGSASDASESPSPSVTPIGRRKRKRAASATPVSALGQLNLSAPGSATIQTDSSVFTFDGSLADLDAKRAELNAKIDEERERLRQQEEGRGKDGG